MLLLESDIVVKSKKWNEEGDIEAIVAEIAAKIIPLTELSKITKNSLNVEFSISLVSDAQMRKTNFEFRQKDKTTNVLSFPNLDENLIHEVGLKELVGDCGYLFLGDIVVAYETMKKESLAQKKKFYDHLTHLILHSILHLLGYDHEDEEMAKNMESLEIKILKKLGIANPYIN